MSFDLTTLGEYARIQGGYAYKSKDFSEHGTCPVLKIKNVRFGTVDYSEASYISECIAEQTCNWRTQEGDILISMTGSGPNAPQSLVGRVARIWNNEPAAWINQRVGKVVIKEKGLIHPDFLFYLLSSPASQDFLVSNSSGSANQANISSATIEALPCPKVSYQQSSKIAEVLIGLDEKIILNHQTNQTLEQIAQAIFKNWFIDFEPTRAKALIKNQGGKPAAQELAAQAIICGALTLAQLQTLATSSGDLAQQLQSQIHQKFADSNGLDLWPPEQLVKTAALFPNGLVDSELGEIPEGWGVEKLGSTTEIIMGQSPKGDTYNELDDGLPLVNGPVEFGNYHPKKIKWTTAPTRISKNNDLIVCVRGSTTGRFIKSNGEYCLGRGVCAIRLDNYQPYADYLFKFHIPNLLSLTTGSTFPSWNGPVLKNYKIVRPDNSILFQFSSLVGGFEEKISNSEVESENLSKIRDCLLPKLLSGETLLRTDEKQISKVD